MDFNGYCKLCDREAVNSSGLCAKHLKESQASALPAVSCTEWMDELAKRIARRRDEKKDYPETEYGKAAGLDEALELLATLRSEIESSSIAGDQR